MAACGEGTVFGGSGGGYGGSDGGYADVYVSWRLERRVHDDGRRCNLWYLVDEMGCEQLAVVGEERETRDGHYQYTAVSSIAALCCCFFVWKMHSVCLRRTVQRVGGQGEGRALPGEG